jgi:histidine phosphotransferase ChpT
MGVEVDFRVLELLCGRLCHELISPVGAINNGVELLDEDDPEFVKEAMALIAQSARSAGQRLQFYRFAYGTAVTASGAAADGRSLSQGLLEGGKVRCDWPEEAGGLPPPWQRLACNMLVLALELMPRGGAVTVWPLERGVAVTAEAEIVTASAELQSVLADEVAVDALTPRTVHGFYTMRLAQHIGARLVLVLGPNRAVLTASAGG